MIAESRDADFWRLVAADPQVAPHVTLGQKFDIARLINHPLVTAFRSDNGGFIFVRLSPVVYELHTMFLPCAWGTREILNSAREAFDSMFAKGAQIVTTYEVAGNPRSKPPKTFRFEPAGPFVEGQFASLRTWVLTANAWAKSPAKESMPCL